LLVNAFLVPEPYSHPLIQVALAPTRLMPFLESEGLVRGFTIAIFGRMTPNFAPITILVLIGLWFIVGLVGSIVFLKIGRRKDACRFVRAETGSRFIWPQSIAAQESCYAGSPTSCSCWVWCPGLSCSCWASCCSTLRDPKPVSWRKPCSIRSSATRC